MLYILGGDAQQALRTADWLEIPRDRFRIIRDANDLRGIDRPKILQVGTFWRNKQYNQIMDVANHLGAFVSSLNDRL